MPLIRPARRRSIDPISVVTCLCERKLLSGETAVPYPLGFVTEWMQTHFQNRPQQIVRAIKKQSHFPCVLRVERKIVRVFFCNIADAERVGRSFNGWPIDGLRFRDVRTHSGKKNPFPNSPGGARSIHNAGRGNFLCRGRATHPKILTPRKYWANSRRARTTHHDGSNPARGDAKRKTATNKAPKFSPLMVGARTSRLPNAYPGRSCGTRDCSRRLAHKFRRGENPITGLPELRPAQIAPCRMCAVQMHTPSHILSDDRSARFHPCVQRPYWCGVVTSDSDSLISVVWRPISPAPSN